MELIVILVVIATLVVVTTAVVLTYYVSNDIEKWRAANLSALDHLDFQLESFKKDENVAQQLVETIVQLPDDPSEIAADLKNEANNQLQVARENNIVDRLKKSTTAASSIVKKVDGEIKTLANQITTIANKHQPRAVCLDKKIKELEDEYKRAQQLVNEIDLCLPGDDKIVGVGDGYSAFKANFDPALAPEVFSGTSYKQLKVNDFSSSLPSKPFCLLCAFEFLRSGTYTMQWSIVSPSKSKAELSISILDNYSDTTNVNKVIQESKVNNPNQAQSGNEVIVVPKALNPQSSLIHLAVFINIDPNTVDKSGKAWVNVRPLLEE